MRSTRIDHKIFELNVIPFSAINNHCTTLQEVHELEGREYLCKVEFSRESEDAGHDYGASAMSKRHIVPMGDRIRSGR